MKSLFSFKRRRQRSIIAPRKRRSHLWFFVFMLFSLMLAGYFVAPKMINFMSEAKTEPAEKEQIIKPFPMPNMESLVTVQPVQSPPRSSPEMISP